MLARQIQLEVGPEVFSEYFKFSIVRNPWDKAVSQFSYMKSRADLREFIGMKEDDEFKRYLSLIQRKCHVQWMSQYLFLEGDNGESLVNFIGKFEDFEIDVHQILKKLQIGMISRIPHNNKSCRTDYRDYYDSESQEMVLHMYAQDIAKFGYSF